MPAPTTPRRHLARLAAALAILAGAAGAASAQRATLVATITAAGSERPVPGAAITVATASGGALSAVTDSAGRATLTGIPAGVRQVVVEMLGFAGERLFIDFGAGAVVEAEIALMVRPVELEEMEVRVKAPPPGLSGTGFAERRRVSAGTFITGAELRPRVDGGSHLSDVLRSVRGIRVVPRRSGPGYTLASSRGEVSVVTDCPPRLLLDGVPQPVNHPAFELDMLIPLNQVSAIEVYPGPAETPMEFGGSLAACGVVVIWTHRGAVSPGG